MQVMRLSDKPVIMNRRRLLFVPLSLLAVRATFAAGQPWSARLLKGGFDGTRWWSGVAIELEHKWKTYWRMPGAGGIAPAFDLKGDNIAASQVDYPIPKSIAVEGVGTIIGYSDTVVFPIAVSPGDAARPVSVSLKAFFGVCDDVCIPALLEQVIVFDPAKSDAPDQVLISQWRSKVPVLTAAGPVTKAAVQQDADGLFVVFEISEPVSRLFVEGNPMHFFQGPKLIGGLMRMKVVGAKSADEVRQTALRLTLQTHSKVLEQIVTVV
jgi:DsbC/DsbD-like thiol-disulfide interchange protein